MNPSPNLRSLAALASYPGTVYFEGTNLSEGRGTDRPFEQIGAPWLDAAAVVATMNAMGLPGIAFQAVTILVADTAASFPDRPSRLSGWPSPIGRHTDRSARRCCSLTRSANSIPGTSPGSRRSTRSPDQIGCARRSTAIDSRRCWLIGTGGRPVPRKPGGVPAVQLNRHIV